MTGTATTTKAITLIKWIQAGLAMINPADVEAAKIEQRPGLGEKEVATLDEDLIQLWALLDKKHTAFCVMLKTVSVGDMLEWRSSGKKTDIEDEAIRLEALSEIFYAEVRLRYHLGRGNIGMRENFTVVSMQDSDSMLGLGIGGLRLISLATRL